MGGSCAMNGCVAQWGGWCKGGILLPQCGYISLVNYKKDFLFCLLAQLSWKDVETFFANTSTDYVNEDIPAL